MSILGRQRVTLVRSLVLGREGGWLRAWQSDWTWVVGGLVRSGCIYKEARREAKAFSVCATLQSSLAHFYRVPAD